jgi:hypothetical protein
MGSRTVGATPLIPVISAHQLYSPVRATIYALAFAIFGVVLWQITMGTAQAYVEIGGQSFACAGGRMVAGSKLFNSSSCAGVSGTFAIFSEIICRFETLINNLYGNLFCGMQANLLEPLKWVMILHIGIYGLMLVMGVVQASIGEGVTHLVKSAVVWAFCTNAELAIGMGYNFFIASGQELISIILSSLADSGGTVMGGADAFRQTDLAAQRVLGIFNNNVWFGVALLLILLWVCPPLFLLIVTGMAQTFMLFARGVLGYLMGLIGVTFLLTLSPIFLSFMLFDVTRHLFDKWLKFLASFTLQMVIVFAFVALTLETDVWDFFNEMSGIVGGYRDVWGIGPLGIPVTLYSICRLQRLPATADYPSGQLVIDLPGRLENVGGQLVKVVDNNMANQLPVCQGNPAAGEVMPIGEIIYQGDFIMVLVQHAMSLIVIAYAMNAGLAAVPQMARALTGGLNIARLGATKTIQNAHNGDLYVTGLGAVEGAGEGFAAAFRGARGNGFEKLMAGLRGGGDSFLNGTGGRRGAPGLYSELSQEAASLGRNPTELGQMYNPNHSVWAQPRGDWLYLMKRS